MRFFVDGTEVGSDTTAPYTFEWDTSMVADGDHVIRADAEDAAGNVGQSGEVTITVRNTIQIVATLSGSQEVPPVETEGSGTADVTVNLVTGDITGELLLTNLTVDAAHIHDAFAGANGNVLIGLEVDGADPDRFVVPGGATLDADGIERLLAGALYVNAHTAAVPAGEIRGQLLPEDFRLFYSVLSGDEQVPRVTTLAGGRAAITVNDATGATVVQAYVHGLDDADMAHVHEGYAGANGPVVIALTKDPTDPGRWSAEDGELNAAGLDALNAGRLYINVHSPDYPPGEVRGQIVPDGITVLFTELSGEQEVPAVDTRASGLAAITLDESSSMVSIHVNNERLDDANGAHLHSGFGGDTGPVEIGLNQDGSAASHWFAEDEMLSAEQLGALLAGGTYINVHSPDHGPGEIRGQVIPDGIHFAFGFLEGRQEVPAIASAAGGTFAVTVDPVAMSMTAHANTTGADDATAAHVHDAYAGTNGGVVVGLAQDPNDVSRWSVVDAALDADQLAAFTAGRYYVNVHTPANQPGEVRGQIAPPPIEVLISYLDGGQEVPSVDSIASGIAASTVNRYTGTMTLHLNTSNAETASASHVHVGYAGQNGDVLIGLTQDEADAAHWSVTGFEMDEAGLLDYLEGRLYVNLHTPANPPGEIRGQIVPDQIQVLLSDIDGDQVVPPVVTAASGVIATTANLRYRSLAVFVNAAGVDDATSAGVHLAGLGMNGDEIFPLAPTAGVPGQWSGIDGGLDAATFLSYRAGRLYAQVATPANPAGEIRGQIVPPDAAEFDDIPPAVTLDSPGAEVVGTVELTADATDDQGVSVVRFLANGNLIGSDDSAPYSVQWDSTTVANGQVTLTASADDLAGNTGVSDNVVVTVNNPTPVTLTQLQTEIFGPRCSGCHSGPTSNSLPSGMNLSSAANSHAALVNVASIQQPGVDRVEPFDPDGSYLVRKLEGDPSISGTRMPQGGPFLDQAAIDRVRQWITDGAENN